LPPFSDGKSYVLIIAKMDWATHWPTFSQTNLVTLLATKKMPERFYLAANRASP
jgi:hypothetical protein